jgi:cell division protein FtsB
MTGPIIMTANKPNENEIQTQLNNSETKIVINNLDDLVKYIDSVMLFSVTKQTYVRNVVKDGTFKYGIICEVNCDIEIESKRGIYVIDEKTSFIEEGEEKLGFIAGRMIDDDQIPVSALYFVKKGILAYDNLKIVRTVWTDEFKMLKNINLNGLSNFIIPGLIYYNKLSVFLRDILLKLQPQLDKPSWNAQSDNSYKILCTNTESDFKDDGDYQLEVKYPVNKTENELREYIHQNYFDKIHELGTKNDRIVEFICTEDFKNEVVDWLFLFKQSLVSVDYYEDDIPESEIDELFASASVIHGFQVKDELFKFTVTPVKSENNSCLIFSFAKIFNDRPKNIELFYKDLMVEAGAKLLEHKKFKSLFPNILESINSKFEKNTQCDTEHIIVLAYAKSKNVNVFDVNNKNLAKIIINPEFDTINIRLQDNHFEPMYDISDVEDPCNTLNQIQNVVIMSFTDKDNVEEKKSEPKKNESQKPNKVKSPKSQTKSAAPKIDIEKINLDSSTLQESNKLKENKSTSPKNGMSPKEVQKIKTSNIAIQTDEIESKNDLEEISLQLESLKKENNELSDGLKDALKTINKLNSIIEDRGKVIEKLESRITELQHHEIENQKIKTENEQLKAEMEKGKEMYVELQTDYNVAVEEIKTLTDLNKTREFTIDQQDKIISGCEAEINVLRTENDSLKGLNDRLLARLRAAETSQPMRSVKSMSMQTDFEMILPVDTSETLQDRMKVCFKTYITRRLKSIYGKLRIKDADYDKDLIDDFVNTMFVRTCDVFKDTFDSLVFQEDQDDVFT